MIEIEGKLEPDDYVKAQFLHMRPGRAWQLIGTFVLLLMLWGLWLEWSDPSAKHDWLDYVLLGAVFYVPAFIFLFIPWNARRIFRQQKSMQREFTMRFDETGHYAKNETTESSTPWSDFPQWKENKHLFLIYISDPLFICLPKRLFAPGDSDRFRELIAEHIGEPVN